jgi:hypothetical protein
LLAPVFAAACARPALRTTPLRPAAAATTTAGPASFPVGTFVSEELRFALRPTRGWRVLTPEASHEVNHDAVIVATGRHLREGCVGTVFVDPAPDSDLETAANTRFMSDRTEAARILTREHVQFANTNAVRTEMDGAIEGAPIQAVRMLFLHQGYRYALVVSGTHVDAAAAREFFDAFELLPGVVTPAWAFPDTVEASGPGWRIRERRFESANFGFAVTPGTRWRFVPAPALETLNQSAEVGLVSRDPEAYFVLIPERVPPARRAAYLDTVAQEVAAHPAGDSQDVVTVSLAGAPRRLSRATHDGVDTLRGAWCDGEQCTQALVWGAHRERGRIQRLLSETPPIISSLAEPERAALAAALQAPDPALRSTGLDYSLRGGRYVHYERGLTLQLPPGHPWRVRAGADARGVRTTLSLFFEEPRLGLLGILMSEPLSRPTSNATFHAQVRSSIGLPSGQGSTLTPVRLDRVEGVWSEETGPRGFRYRVVTAVRGDLGFRLVVWAYPELHAAAHDALDALVRGFALSGGPVSPRGREGERWVDSQFGYAIRMPADAMQTDTTVYVMRGTQRVDQWRVGERSVEVAAFSAGAVSEGSTNRILEEIRRRVAQATPALSLDWEATTLASRPARRLSARGSVNPAQFYCVDVGGTLYVLTISGPPGAESDSIAQGFELLP